MYYILDCNGNKVGNTKGYRTFKGTERQQNSVKSKAYTDIWLAYYDHCHSDKFTQGNNLVSSINQVRTK